MSFKGAIAIAQKHADIVIALIRSDDVKVTIAVHIAQGHGEWAKSTSGEGGLSLKGAIAIAQEHADVFRVKICGDDVESAIAVHIAQAHGAWISSGGEIGFGTKGAIAIAQEHADAFRGIRGDHIESTIAVHITKRHRLCSNICGEGGLSCKQRQGSNGGQIDQVHTKGAATSDAGNIYGVSVARSGYGGDSAISYGSSSN